MAYVTVFFSALVIAVGLIMFKLAAFGFTGFGENLVAALFTNRTAITLVVGAMALYAVSTVGWVYALRSVPLS